MCFTVSYRECVCLLGCTAGVERHVHAFLLCGTLCPLPPPSLLSKPLGHFHHVLPEGGPHEGVEDGVEAAVGEGQALRHLSHLIQHFARPAVGHQDVDRVHRSVHLQHVVRQLSDHVHPHHYQENSDSSTLLASALDGDALYCSANIPVADHHDQERKQEAKQHLCYLQGGFPPSTHRRRVDSQTDVPVRRPSHLWEKQIREAEDESRHPGD